MTQAEATSGLLTVGQISARVNEDRRAERLPEVSEHQIKYALSTYKIAPAGRVGILRVWTEDDIPRVKSALARVASNRGDA